MPTLFKAILWLACIGLWIATIAGMAAPLFPLVELLNHFRPFLVAGARALSIMVWLVRSRALRLTAIAGLALNLVLGAAPFLYSAPKAADASALDLRVMAMNVWARNTDIDRMRDEILKQQPDVIVFQEYRSHHQPLLDALRETMPYQQTCAAQGPCGLAMASKIPWTSTGAIGEGEQGGNPPLIWADFTIAEKPPFRIYGVHLDWPFNPIDQAANIDWLIGFLPRLDRPYIIAGDFNLSPWSWKLNKLAAETGLRRHVTFALSWPMHRLMPFVLIDNVLATPDFANLSAQAVGRVGSDHAPLIVSLALP
ncbi:MAG: endonuclease/exonuclease/phosphatase family protein [Rhizobiales bacterium]|nr:endonuclease/exonuclease/phosphatase family protein [Hyphomicrobiales bacterium]